jgi:adenine phosphoribosyltransferase
MLHLKQLIREIPDWPKPGILFYDITTLMKDGDGFGQVIQGLTSAVQANDVDVVIGIEARGFFFAPTVAHSLGKGFVPVRKPKKLPAAVEAVEYALEYGTDKLEIHQDAIQPGQRVLIVDDVLATGGTAAAVASLVEQLGGTVAALSFVIELDFLEGRRKLGGRPIHSLLHY